MYFKTDIRNDTLGSMLFNQDSINRSSLNNSKTKYKITQIIGHLLGINENVPL